MTSEANFSLAVLAGDAASVGLARQTASDYALPFIAASDHSALAGIEYLLTLSSDGPCLENTNGLHGSLRIDFTSGRAAHRRRFGGGRKQPLARAIGIGKPGINTVVDATAGFGGDSFVLASLGVGVLMLERQPALAIMLADALARARLDKDTAEIANRMRLEYQDARLWLLDEKHAASVDSVYLDPMYPHQTKRGKTKRALAKKNMQALQALAGPDTDSEFLLHAALSCAARRVVVKRPANADPLAGRAPSTSISSPNTRYDVYLI